MIEGNTTGKTSEVVREFKQCPPGSSSAATSSSQALQHNTYGRKRSATKRAPAGLGALTG